MDIAIHWGIIRHLNAKVSAKRWVPAVAILLDAVVCAFVVMKIQTDVLTVTVAAAIALAIFLSQWYATSRRRDDATTRRQR